MGTIEFHAWACHTDDVERPDRMIFDLDPDEGLEFSEVRRAAREVQEQFADIGLVSFAMLAGGKGVHVVVPLLPGQGWDAHADFAWRFVHAMSAAQPARLDGRCPLFRAHASALLLRYR